MFDRFLAGALDAYSLLFVGLHAIPLNSWAVDFVPVWGRLAMVVAYVISIDRAASTIGRFLTRVTARLPTAVWTIGWMIGVFALLWAFRDHRRLGDGPTLIQMISDGYRYDPHSLVGIFLQSILFQLGQHGFGWTAETTWALTSVLWGLAFIPALTTTCREIFDRDRMAAVAVALVATQATSAYYFGYIEDYIAPSVLVLLYVRAASRAMRGEGHVALPGLLLGTALLFSMGWAFLLPSLGWLALEVSKGRRYGRLLGAALSCPALLFAVMAAFHFVLGVDVIALYGRSHLAHLATYSAVSHYAGVWAQVADLVQLHLLVAPYALLLGALLLLSSSARSAFREPIGRFLAVTAACGLLMGIVWFPALGMERDWDLFALFGTPLSLFAAFLLARYSAEPQLRPQINRALLLTAIHTLFWIWTGHVAH